jgi:ribosomal-protein-alanine N-acetyltransferase
MPVFDIGTIATERLVLRLLTPADAQAMFTIFSNPEVMRYGSGLPWTSMEQADEYLAKGDQAVTDGVALRVGIEAKNTGCLVGQAALFAFSEQNRRCDIGYSLGREHWGNGYAGEALRALLGYGFDGLGLNRMEADVDPRNGASVRLLERLGFQREGYMPERWIVGDEVCDTVFYGLLKRHWNQ